MSYSIDVVRGGCSHCHREADSVCEVNVTTNLARIVEELLFAYSPPPVGLELDGTYSWRRLAGWRAGDALPILRFALERLTVPSEFERLRRWEPGNGWGTIADVQEALRELTAAARAHPDARILVRQ